MQGKFLIYETNELLYISNSGNFQFAASSADGAMRCSDLYGTSGEDLLHQSNLDYSSNYYDYVHNQDFELSLESIYNISYVRWNTHEQ